MPIPVSPPPPPVLRIEALRRRLGVWAALADVSLTLAPGEAVAVLGGAGAGKSTLIRILAGLERPDSGRVLWGERNLARVAAHRRGFGVVLQEEWLDLRESLAANVALPLRWRRVRRARRRALVEHALELVGLLPRSACRAGLASAAERQLAVLARALVREPALLLLDDPLHRQVGAGRLAVQAGLRRARAQLGASMLIATPDAGEAMALGDRVAVLDRGEVLAVGEGRDLYSRPPGVRVARALGECAVLPGEVRGVEADEAVVALEAGGVMAAMAGPRLVTGGRCQVCVRPENVAVMPGDGGAAEAGMVPGVVSEVVPWGDRVRVGMRLAGGMEIVALRPGGALGPGVRVGEPVLAAWQARHGMAFAG